MKVGVTITTHNRREELARTLAQLARLDPPPDETLVCADGSTDGTAELVREHSHIRLLIHESARGSIDSRNELIRASSCEVLVSFDDDSYPIDVNFIAQVRELFATSPRTAVVSFAQRTDEFPETLTTVDFGAANFVASYANSAAAIRRTAFDELGGYPDFFFHAYEEPDFALRCVCAGWQVRAVPSPLVRHHFTKVRRNEARMHRRHARNEFWSILLRCPAVLVVPVAVFRALRQFGYAWRRGSAWVVQEPLWWWQALLGVPRCLAARRPAKTRAYLAWMRLMRRPIESEAEWNAQFAPDAP